MLKCEGGVKCQSARMEMGKAAMCAGVGVVIRAGGGIGARFWSYVTLVSARTLVNCGK